MTLSLCLPAASFLIGAIIPVDGGDGAQRLGWPARALRHCRA
jgi:hypothetical protein